jgi:hypothetical protein
MTMTIVACLTHSPRMQSAHPVLGDFNEVSLHLRAYSTSVASRSVSSSFTLTAAPPSPFVPSTSFARPS